MQFGILAYGAGALAWAVAALLASRGIQLISYRPLRDLYRKSLI